LLSLQSLARTEWEQQKSEYNRKSERARTAEEQDNGTVEHVEDCEQRNSECELND